MTILLSQISDAANNITDVAKDKIDIYGVYINNTQFPVRKYSVIALPRGSERFYINFETNEGVEVSQEGMLPFNGDEQDYIFTFHKDGRQKQMHIKFIEKDVDSAETGYVFPSWVRYGYIVVIIIVAVIFLLPDKKSKNKKE